MPNILCTTCGTQYAESDQPPAACAICQDDRQYVKATGQNWTTLDKLRLTNRNSIKFKEAGLIGVGVEPHFAIGQRALFLRTPKANVLWDCLPLLDEAVVEAVKALGGISAIGGRGQPGPLFLSRPGPPDHGRAAAAAGNDDHGRAAVAAGAAAAAGGGMPQAAVAA
jgi:hypothetical protein